jgi:hypothetical protein
MINGKTRIAVDEQGIESSRKLQARHPGGRLYGIRIGYNVAESPGGVMSTVCRKRPVCTTI